MKIITNLKFGYVFLLIFIGINIYWYITGGGESPTLFTLSWISLFIAALYGRAWTATWKD